MYVFDSAGMNARFLVGSFIKTNLPMHLFILMIENRIYILKLSLHKARYVITVVANLFSESLNVHITQLLKNHILIVMVTKQKKVTYLNKQIFKYVFYHSSQY